MKKIISVFLFIISLFLLSFTSIDVMASESDKPTIKSQSAYLIDSESGTVLFSKNENERLPIASMTKMMLLNLCFEKFDEGAYSLTDKTVISKTAAGMGGSQVFLESGKEYEIKDLVKSIIVASANDASVAMAEFLYGSESACVEEMNAKCAEWGLEDTLFSNCTGLTQPTQYSTAKDVATILNHLVKHKEYFEFSSIWTDEIHHSGTRKTGLANTNKLIRFYEGCDGGKTGYTSEAGHCLASTAKRGGLRLVSVVIHAPDSKTRFRDTSEMFNYGFDNYSGKMVVDKSRSIDIKVSVEKGKKDNIAVRPSDDIFVFSKKNEKPDVIIDFKPRKIVAPINKGDAVGELIVYKDNIEYKRVEVIAEESVAKKVFFDYIGDIASKW